MLRIDLPSAETLDAADPLASFRDRFVIDDPALVYLDGNSLGRLPRATEGRLRTLVRGEWGGDLIRGWERWLDLPARVGDLLAEGVLGARPDEVIVGDSTTVNLYRLAAAALEARPGRRTVLVPAGEFPTDRYVLEGLARARGLALRRIDIDPVEGVSVPDVAAALEAAGGDAALVVLSHVHYRSGALAELPAITAVARAAGALALWDLSHSAGALPIRLDESGADLAVGCTYKYLNGGPGAPAFAYVRRERQAELRTPIQGWFGQRAQFEMDGDYDALPGIRGWLAGTPSVLALAAVEEGVRLVAEAGLERIRAKALALGEYAVALHDAWLAPLGCTLGSPRDAARRGSHLAVRHPDARRLSAALVDDGVIPDFRPPDSIRLGLSPLTTRFADVRAGLARLRTLLEAGA